MRNEKREGVETLATISTTNFTSYLVDDFGTVMLRIKSDEKVSALAGSLRNSIADLNNIIILSRCSINDVIPIALDAGLRGNLAKMAKDCIKLHEKLNALVCFVGEDKKGNQS